MLNYNIDDIDRRILIALQENGRATNYELSERVGLSPSPCLRRIRVLESTGAIERYTALVNPESLGLSVTAFVRVRLGGQDDRHLEEFENTIADFQEVMECYLMTGEADYQLRVLVSSLAHFEDFLRQKLTRIDGVSQVTTSFGLRPIVYRTALPIS
ncbi:MAG: Lrp/AsnC family transcriptional regulator [Parasphingorhabdus sp.]|uniref:Lrp/AsnC family transcriptional regulator n=1 Tax=Parasphingorhabdus sp. TaxID=2709688 RepID=UPI0030015186